MQLVCPSRGTTNRLPAERHQIRSIPTRVLFQHGAELSRLSGAMPASQLTAWIRQHLPAQAA